jgi:rhamnogalacturonan endolyase
MMTSHFRWLAAFFALLFYSHLVFAGINSTDTPSRLTISNARLTVSLNKSIGAIDFLSLDGQDLLGQSLSEEPRPGGPTGNGISGVGPYLDCYCVKEGSGSYTPGSHNATIKLIQGTEGGGVGGKVFAGFSMRDVNPRSGQIMEFYAFLRENETGLHTFSRLAYPSNKTGPTRNVLQEFRTMFRPNSPLWTHIVANNQTIAPLPMRKHLKAARFVQDATYDLTAYRDDPYVQQTSNYFTKYSFSDTFKDHEAHGLYADGTGGGQGYRNVTWFGKNDTWGAWLVTWNKETYYGGPLRSDLTVDGIVYDYMGESKNSENCP